MAVKFFHAKKQIDATSQS